ncbi:MAG TPA: hypothetical protein VIM30_09185 [Candidatus Limnocylindrales bacterium]
MSQHHQASRRRSFARRQRQLRERVERIEHGRRWEPGEPGEMGWPNGPEAGSESVARVVPSGPHLELRGAG